MANYTLQKLPNEPIIVFVIGKSFSVTNELEGSIAEREKLLDAQPEPVYFIQDHTDMAFTFDELLAATNKLGGGSNSLFHHPKIRKLLLVVPSAILQETIKGMASSHAFGRVASVPFATLNEALEFARSGQ